uniref:Uncharacterized protein n=1 Tax=Chromera velia CCMP2878 TaxID=1169474 RepID=A0A0G4ID49_9ALVE|eukprot:Cvel_13266.t1-p1 / transcript=Cvel_13266.t1 / gene=Cvel_13266 / organism=Chromera_velia_CCMP2878 / gene_product=hypothetical protein / transcript_product=hypothetical protein / location=Cvel_scaffold899:55734-57701(+) / protein_length=228 / sequence_SO=supercontig / SO=protein_coding / is_pseudo=false
MHHIDTGIVGEDANMFSNGAQQNHQGGGRQGQALTTWHPEMMKDNSVMPQIQSQQESGEQGLCGVLQRFQQLGLTPSSAELQLPNPNRFGIPDHRHPFPRSPVESFGDDMDDTAVPIVSEDLPGFASCGFDQTAVAPTNSAAMGGVAFSQRLSDHGFISGGHVEGLVNADETAFNFLPSFSPNAANLSDSHSTAIMMGDSNQSPQANSASVPFIAFGTWTDGPHASGV